MRYRRAAFARHRALNFNILVNEFSAVRYVDCQLSPQPVASQAMLTLTAMFENPEFVCRLNNSPATAYRINVPALRPALTHRRTATRWRWISISPEALDTCWSGSHCCSEFLEDSIENGIFCSEQCGLMLATSFSIVGAIFQLRY
jgi:hypothetical protein